MTDPTFDETEPATVTDVVTTNTEAAGTSTLGILGVSEPKEEDDELTGSDPLHTLYIAVKSALHTLPAYFKTELNITGIPATDLQSFNTSLGATIEVQAVEALNGMRPVWDKNNQYADYTFVRQAQRFPDVILRAASPDTEPQILMGIELKGWYVLSKEGEPSFRYQVTPAVNAPNDLLVVYPWALANVIGGTPRLLEPFIVNARYAAKYRNYHWEHVKKAQGERSTGIVLSDVTRTYPTKADEIHDKPVSDNGKNFGRFARTGIMDAYKERLLSQNLLGIPIVAWIRFLSLFSEDKTEAQILRGIDAMTTEAERRRLPLSSENIETVRTHLASLVEALVYAPAESASASRRKPPRSPGKAKGELPVAE